MATEGLFYLLAFCLYYIGQWKTDRKVVGEREAMGSGYNPGQIGTQDPTVIQILL